MIFLFIAVTFLVLEVLHLLWSTIFVRVDFDDERETKTASFCEILCETRENFLGNFQTFDWGLRNETMGRSRCYEWYQRF